MRQGALKAAACIVAGLILSLGFNAFFLRLSERPLTEQALAILALALALSYVFYFAWERVLKVRPRWHFKVSFPLAALRDNAAGLALALLFFGVYLYYGLLIGGFSARQVDNLFDTDSADWAYRIANPQGGTFDMRGPHPFAYFLFRPLGLFLNLFTHEHFLSALVLNALAGGACVFLAWLFLKRQFENKVYAFLMAALLGLTTSHLILGSLVETYIFSAFALVLFCVLAGSERSSLASLVASAALTFGITLTNFVQNVIAFTVSRPRWKEILRFTGWTLSIALILTYLHAARYPSSRLFFLPSEAVSEETFFAPFEPPLWRISGRLMLLLRTALLTTVIAPDFYALTEGTESALPLIRFFRILPGAFHYGGYDALGKILVIIWASLLLAAGIAFAWKLIRARKADLSLAFALCLAFNLALHLVYGEDPFLYSPNWAYALIFFLAFGLAQWKHGRLFQAGFSTFLILLAYHQGQFLAALYQTLLPYMR